MSNRRNPPEERPTVSPDGSSSTNRRLRRGALALTCAWAGLMVFLATVPRVPDVPSVSPHLMAATGHVAMHGLLAGLVFLSLVLWPFHRRHLKRTVLIAISLPFAYGALLEFVQSFLSARSASVEDLVLNAIGAGGGAIGAALLVVSPLSLRQIWVAAGLGTGCVLLAVSVWFLFDDPSLPRVGDHWHARYSIRICGETREPLPGTHGAIHTHGNGFIHIHPFDASQAGSNATLALFMETSGGGLEDTSIVLPAGWGRFENGDRCPNGLPGSVSIWVNGRQVESGSAYIPRDGDVIELVFGDGPYLTSFAFCELCLLKVQ